MSIFKSVVVLILYTAATFSAGYHYVKEVQSNVESKIIEQDLSLKLQVAENLRRTEILLQLNRQAAQVINELRMEIRNHHPVILRENHITQK